ncbi:sulfite reductase subunit alpha [Caulobacter sp. NIBR2454]|uniref:sulfite reductase subunit alpha n=1 Tax=Caulobacter sp. NIBR2454 TaxID=3015996 RepID=UPI0022B62CBA|nr:sulfite reductase subunit alpha [Caulobacter sp. NIBR2454]
MNSLPALTVERLLWAAAAILAYALFCGGVALRRALMRRRARRQSEAMAGGGEAVLVVYASQTGFAEDLAWTTAKALQIGEVGARVISIGDVTAQDLSAAKRALFVASTTGEGDAPDSAARFVSRVMAIEPDLSGLSYGLLSLGDSSYIHFSAFGRRLDAWLTERGAAPLFDRIEVDDGDEGALRHWQHQLSAISGVTDAPDWSRPAYERWKLVERRLLNPGSPGGEAWHVALEPAEGSAAWAAGDIAEIGPRNGPDEAGAPSHREYSIASIPQDGRIELIVRQMVRPDGGLGVGSGWLTKYAEIGGDIDLRVRTNRAFHAPEPSRPLILIGAGTGLAGLRAHLKARAAAGARRNWLIFGERSAATDYFHQAEIEAWTNAGAIERLTLAFSRDQAERVYVQHRLAEAADDLRLWVASGAAIYVCGGIEMGKAVGATLTDILGAQAMADLTEKGFYRRDVY